MVNLYEKLSRSALVKAGLLIVASFSTNFALSISSLLVNEITGINPSSFPHTVALISILCIPLFISLGLGISLVAIVLLSPLFIALLAFPDDKTNKILFPYYSTNQNIPYFRTTRTVQIISFFIFCGYVVYFAKDTANGYVSFLSDTARDYIYQWEMYPKSPCETASGTRVAFLGDSKLLVAEKNGKDISFTVQTCKSK
ncbi:hypothetical protein HC024_21490 [Methylococcaceae bacterium WWC4]|nr:hypothetical protein [Methylococcaceae bacterium WWC4]